MKKDYSVDEMKKIMGKDMDIPGRSGKFCPGC